MTQETVKSPCCAVQEDTSITWEGWTVILGEWLKAAKVSEDSVMSTPSGLTS